VNGLPRNADATLSRRGVSGLHRVESSRWPAAAEARAPRQAPGVERPCSSGGGSSQNWNPRAISCAPLAYANPVPVVAVRPQTQEPPA
jgi:hypothetical protein